MNSLLLIIIGFPILEIALMIKIGKMVGILNTILLIFFTAIVGIYYAKAEGLNTIRSGMVNLYQNKLPFYELISGASIAIAAILLITPGFVSDTIGFLLLFPLTRKLIIKIWFRNKYKNNHKPDEEIIDAEIIEEKKDKDEL
ncbi:FxsA family protein [Pelagibacteraceae bacterium]|jgi:UPF0716 protein FxsA|nr:FxsA family protein [Pelagibacteraceae bacterium]